MAHRGSLQKCLSEAKVVLLLTVLLAFLAELDGSRYFQPHPKCRVFQVGDKTYKNCFYGTAKTRTSTSTSTITSTSTSTSTRTSTSTATSTSTRTSSSTSSSTSTSTATSSSTSTITSTSTRTSTSTSTSTATSSSTSTSTSTATSSSTSTSTSTATSSSTSTSTSTATSSSTSSSTSTSTRTSTSTSSSTSTSTSTATSSSTSTSTSTRTSTSTSTSSPGQCALPQTSSSNLATIQTSLVNQWAFNGNLIDSKTGVAATATGTITYANDQLNQASKAAYFNNAFITLPSAVYFSGDFSVLQWVNTFSYNGGCKFLGYFGVGSTDTFFWDFCVTSLYSYIWSNGVYSSGGGGTTFTYGVWIHAALSLSGTTLFTYLNGCLVSTDTVNAPRGVTRANSYYGKDDGSWGYLNAYVNNLAIYKRSLTQTEIVTVMNYDSS